MIEPVPFAHLWRNRIRFVRISWTDDEQLRVRQLCPNQTHRAEKIQNAFFTDETANEADDWL